MAVVSLELCTSKTSFHHCYLHHSCSSKVQYGSPWNRHSDVGLAGLSRLSWNIYWLLNEDDDDDNYPHYAVQVCDTWASMSKPTCRNRAPHGDLCCRICPALHQTVCSCTEEIIYDSSGIINSLGIPLKLCSWAYY